MGLVAWLQQEADPARDVILVDQRYPFGLYWPRWNYSADGFPPAEPAGLAPTQYLFVDINTVAERLAWFARGRERVFSVRWFESDTDQRGHDVGVGEVRRPTGRAEFYAAIRCCGMRCRRRRASSWRGSTDRPSNLAIRCGWAPYTFGGQRVR